MLLSSGAGGLLRGPWTARRSNQSNIRQINPEYSLEGLMVKLKLQYFGHLMPRADSLKKTVMLGKIEGRRRRTTEDEMAGWRHQCNGHELGQILGDGEGQGGLACCSPWGCKESRYYQVTERQQQLKNKFIYKWSCAIQTMYSSVNYTSLLQSSIVSLFLLEKCSKRLEHLNNYLWNYHLWIGQEESRIW